MVELHKGNFSLVTGPIKCLFLINFYSTQDLKLLMAVRIFGKLEGKNGVWEGERLAETITPLSSVHL